MRALWWLVPVLLSFGCRHEPIRSLPVATTTSVANSGLLDVLIGEFGREAKINVRSHLVGSGRALEMLAEGDVELAITHAPELETSAMRTHPTWVYSKVMFNDFVIVGPPQDPAKVKEAATAEDAFRRIALSGAQFISRGDESGTHEREKLLWLRAGAQPATGKAVVAGQGMGTTLRIANETDSYTLTDRATFTQNQKTLHLNVVFEGGPSLLNTYAVVVSGRDGDAFEFAEWLTNGRGREVIDAYRAGGARVFNAWPRTAPRSTPTDLPHPP